jgi:hypothetical protein
LAVLAAVMLGRVRARPAVGLVALALVPTIVNAYRIIRLDARQFTIVASGDPRPHVDEAVAEWFQEVRRPGDHLYVMCASAGYYADAHDDPVYPYLWEDNVQQVPGALVRLRDLLASPNAPRYIAVYNSIEACDPTGRLARVIDFDYQHSTRVAGIQILERTP